MSDEISSGFPLSDSDQGKDGIGSIGSKKPRIIRITGAKPAQERKLSKRRRINGAYLDVPDLCVEDFASHVGQIQFGPVECCLNGGIRDFCVGLRQHLKPFADFIPRERERKDCCALWAHVYDKRDCVERSLGNTRKNAMCV
jgi:hypothetical protein